MGCENCSVKKMLSEGCCTNDVGFGTKIIKVDGGRRSIEVCIYLKKDWGGSPYCGYHFMRPVMCKAFFCESSYSDGLDSK